ncbi:ribonuclease H-like domain, reverse transcriptase, RNA-dependent DNA polymerase [Tanacetum coccineum]
MRIEASEEHSIGKHHQVAFDHTCHSFGQIVRKIEPFLVGKVIEHVNKTNTRMILIPLKANDIFAKIGFPLFEVELYFREHHLIRIGNNFLTFNFTDFTRKPFIENVITHHLGIFERGQIDGIRIDAIWKGCDRPFGGEHAYTFAWDAKNSSKFIKTETSLKIVDDKGDGNCFV